MRAIRRKLRRRQSSALGCLGGVEPRESSPRMDVRSGMQSRTKLPRDKGAFWPPSPVMARVPFQDSSLLAGFKNVSQRRGRFLVWIPQESIGGTAKILSNGSDIWCEFLRQGPRLPNAAMQTACRGRQAPPLCAEDWDGIDCDTNPDGVAADVVKQDLFFFRSGRLGQRRPSRSLSQLSKGLACIQSRCWVSRLCEARFACRTWPSPSQTKTASSKLDRRVSRKVPYRTSMHCTTSTCRMRVNNETGSTALSRFACGSGWAVY